MELRIKMLEKKMSWPISKEEFEDMLEEVVNWPEENFTHAAGMYPSITMMRFLHMDCKILAWCNGPVFEIRPTALLDGNPSVGHLEFLALCCAGINIRLRHYEDRASELELCAYRSRPGGHDCWERISVYAVFRDLDIFNHSCFMENSFIESLMKLKLREEKVPYERFLRHNRQLKIFELMSTLKEANLKLTAACHVPESSSVTDIKIAYEEMEEKFK